MAFVPLSRPSKAQSKFDHTPIHPEAEGFNVRLISASAHHRTYFDSIPLSVCSTNKVVLLFLQIISSLRSPEKYLRSQTPKGDGLILSPLSQLRESVKLGSENVFVPKITLPCAAISIAFGCADSRLFAGTEQGRILVFDTTHLFTSSTPVDPIHVLDTSTSPPLQILPNPSGDHDLSQLLAIVRADGTAQVLSAQMEHRAGWMGSNAEDSPVVAAWSPKGKQIALGLRAGDIMTFGLTGDPSPLKHIPPTADGPLVSLQWIGPLHTFRTSYASAGNPPDHIVHLDSRSNTGGFVQMTHPFTMSGRSQNAQVLVLPRWDQEATAEHKVLLIVGDTSSTDLEVVANVGSRWFQQSQENPLNVPLDKNDEDTFLLSLDVDLTDEVPVMYAYLNDGTVQAWYICHPDGTPYPGLISSTAPEKALNQPPDGLSISEKPMTTSPFGHMNSGSFSAFSTQSSTFTPPPPMSHSPSISMEDSTGFGGMSLGNSTSDKPKPNSNVFGPPAPLPLPPDHPANHPTPPKMASFSDPVLVRPASGFGAFGGGPTGGAFSNPKPITSSSVTAFGASPDVAAAFGRPSLGGATFGQSGFGQSQSSFGQTGSASTGNANFGSSTSAGGGFTAFASSAPSTFGVPTKLPSLGGFSKFASSGGSNAFVAAANGTNLFAATSETVSASSNTPSMNVSDTTSDPSPFGKSSSSAAPFGKPQSGGFSSFVSNTSSPFSAVPISSSAPVAHAFSNLTSSSTPVFGQTTNAFSRQDPDKGTSTPAGAFANMKNASPTSVFIKPASGAFTDGQSTSPFLGSSNQAQPQRVSAFGPSAGSTSTANPAFSSPSVLKSAFETPPKASGSPFSAFQGTPVSLNSVPVFTPPPEKEKDTAPLSQAGSFVEVDREDDAQSEGDREEAHLGEGELEEGELEYEGDIGDEDDLAAFLSEGSELGPEEDEEEDFTPSRSPSPTPSDASEASRLSTIREESTTPPGSPEKKTTPSVPIAVPSPTAAGTGPSLFGIGLGRPSTRPTRSSPLAGPSTSAEEIKPPQEAAWKPQPHVIASNPDESKPPRAKTPPLSALSFPSSKPSLPVKTPLSGKLFGNDPPTPIVPSKGLFEPASPVVKPVAPMGKPVIPVANPAVPVVRLPVSDTHARPIAVPPTPSPAPPAVKSGPPPMEEGLQKECALLFQTMTRELDNFRVLAQAASQKRMELGSSAGGSRRASDLGNRARWNLSDAMQFGLTLRSYEKDLDALKENRAMSQKSVRELRSNLLKAGTKREEIGRFIKAQHDPEFAKMLKSRSLGPEHLETQSVLRRGIRQLQDRVQKLEGHLEESKKRLSRANSGTAGLRAPTLDTLNRTFRNMDIALDNQTDDVDRLTTRIAKLEVAASSSTPTRDPRLPGIGHRPPKVTPHVAVTTAAALNAERAAQKLKRALLLVRKEPLMNTQAALAPAPPSVFSTPLRPGADLSTPVKGISLGLTAFAPPSTLPAFDPSSFDLPADNFNPSPPPATRRGAGTKSRVSGSVPLKRTSPAHQPSSFDFGPLPTLGHSPSPSPAPVFDWGPIPAFNKPSSTLPGFNVK
ncbi:unnamed protein product [Mycena citricolor]|uniref:Nucleoporin Nup159/Nup146 N-terminal domain-containing protein n=1 Tax=Mycena citricolor TaxID=2018698 RepID=A0AAD2H618_9AGAR|nr:unnamed protein product [Mycena citricolor]